MGRVVETRPLQEDAVNIHPIVGRRRQLRLGIADVIHSVLAKGEQVNLLPIFPGKVLHRPREKRLWEEDATDPEDGWRMAEVEPHLEEPFEMQALAGLRSSMVNSKPQALNPYT